MLSSHAFSFWLTYFFSVLQVSLLLSQLSYNRGFCKYIKKSLWSEKSLYIFYSCYEISVINSKISINNNIINN